MNITEKKSVNIFGLWYNNIIRYPFGKELLSMENKRAAIRSRRPRPMIRLHRGLKMPSVILTNELDSTCGVPDDVLTTRFIEAVRIEERIKAIKGLPVSKYDKVQGKAYLQYPDGRREYVR